MERRKKPSPNESDRHRQNRTERPSSDASPSSSPRRSRDSHLIGSGINPREWSDLSSAQDRHEEAVLAFGEAIRLNPRDALAHFNKGIVLQNLERHNEAVLAFDETIRLNPQHAGAHFNKGVALSELKRNEEAVLAFDEALRLNPKDANAHYQKGVALFELERYKEAAVAYKEAAVAYKQAFRLKLNPFEA